MHPGFFPSQPRECSCHVHKIDGGSPVRHPGRPAECLHWQTGNLSRRAWDAGVPQCRRGTHEGVLFKPCFAQTECAHSRATRTAADHGQHDTGEDAVTKNKAPPDNGSRIESTACAGPERECCADNTTTDVLAAEGIGDKNGFPRTGVKYVSHKVLVGRYRDQGVMSSSVPSGATGDTSNTIVVIDGMFLLQSTPLGHHSRD